ncbi:hypothetical protein PR048_018922 [Dryococelus australis]|uniref:Uncharacterized protein n=1 Tax=Dryococelus australis TaxID=614101 RepID=A0ABQ9H243_9NEOP|nr:hypothetical protein PR048_018922 [Dryococelus australis]
MKDFWFQHLKKNPSTRSTQVRNKTRILMREFGIRKESAARRGWCSEEVASSWWYMQKFYLSVCVKVRYPPADWLNEALGQGLVFDWLLRAAKGFLLVRLPGAMLLARADGIHGTSGYLTSVYFSALWRNTRSARIRCVVLRDNFLDLVKLSLHEAEEVELQQGFRKALQRVAEWMQPRELRSSAGHQHFTEARSKVNDRHCTADDRLVVAGTGSAVSGCGTKEAASGDTDKSPLTTVCSYLVLPADHKYTSCATCPRSRTRGATVTERLDCSPPTKANRVQSPAGSLPDFRKWESCRTMSLVDESFLGDLPFPLPFDSGAAPYSLQDLDPKAGAFGTDVLEEMAHQKEGGGGRERERGLCNHGAAKGREGLGRTAVERNKTERYFTVKYNLSGGDRGVWEEGGKLEFEPQLTAPFPPLPNKLSTNCPFCPRQPCALDSSLSDKAWTTSRLERKQVANPILPRVWSVTGFKLRKQPMNKRLRLEYTQD